MYGEAQGDGKEDKTVGSGRIQITRANCLSLPLRSWCADAVISIAVFHHLATKVLYLLIGYFHFFVYIFKL